MPEIDFSKFGEIEIHPLSRIKKLSAHKLSAQLAHCATCHTDGRRRHYRHGGIPPFAGDDAKKEGYKMTPLAFLIRATVAALARIPAI